MGLSGGLASNGTQGGHVSASVVSGGPAGPAEWVTGTAYALNQIVSYRSAFYICTLAHTSGSTFSGVGKNWRAVAGSSSTVIFANDPLLPGGGMSTAATTVAGGSNGVNVSTFVGAQTLSVGSAATFPTSGTVVVQTSGGFAAISYAGTTASTFTGCTFITGQPGTMTTGQTVECDNSAAVNGINSLIGTGFTNVNNGIRVVISPGKYVFAFPVVAGPAKWACAYGAAAGSQGILGAEWLFRIQTGSPTAFAFTTGTTSAGQTTVALQDCDATGVEATGNTFPAASASNPQWAIMPGICAFQYTGITVTNPQTITLTGVTDGHGNAGLPAGAGSISYVVAGPAVMTWQRASQDSWEIETLDNSISITGPAGLTRDICTPSTTISGAVALSSVTLPLTGITSVAAGSNGVSVTSFTGTQTLAVASVSGYGSAGLLYVACSGGYALLKYSGTTGGFQNCTYIGGNTGTLSTGGAVSNFVPAGLAWVPSIGGGMGTVVYYNGFTTSGLTNCVVVTGQGGTASAGVTTISCITPPMLMDGLYVGGAGAYLSANVGGFRHANIYGNDHERFGPAKHTNNYSAYFYIDSRYNPGQPDGGNQMWDPGVICNTTYWAVHYVMPSHQIQGARFGMSHYFSQPWSFWGEPRVSSFGGFVSQGMLVGCVWDQPAFEQSGLGLIGGLSSKAILSGGTWIEGNATWNTAANSPTGFSTAFGVICCDVQTSKFIGMGLLTSISTTAAWFTGDIVTADISDDGLLGSDQSSLTNWSAITCWAPRTVLANRKVLVTFPGGLIAHYQTAATIGDLMTLGNSQNNVRNFVGYFATNAKSPPAGVALQTGASGVGAVQTSERTLQPFKVNNKTAVAIPGFTPIYADNNNTGGVTAIAPPPQVQQTAPSTSTTGGTGLTAATAYFYVVVAKGANGQSVVSNEQTVTTGAGATNSNTINWVNDARASSGYRIFRGTVSGTYGTFYDVAAGTSTMLDTGAAGTAGSPLPVWPYSIGTAGAGGSSIGAGANGSADLHPLIGS